MAITPDGMFVFWNGKLSGAPETSGLMDEQGHFTVSVKIDHALWPGDGVFCTRISSAVFKEDLLQLVDRDGKLSEIRPYRIGMPILRRPNVR